MVMRGHLFVVRGRIDALQREATVVGVDADGTVDPADRALFSSGPPALPRTWPEGWGRVASDAVWMVRVSDRDSTEVLLHLRRTLADVAAANLTPGAGRELPLVCVPVLGLPRQADVRPHQWLVDLLTTLRDAASEHGFDIALVTQDPAEHAAAQWLRRTWDDAVDASAERSAVDLGARARRGDLALFLGSAWARGAGVASRDELLASLAKASDDVDTAEAATLSSDDLARLLALHDDGGMRRRLAGEVARVSVPGLVHALVAGLGARAVVTTSQDRLLTQAVVDAGADEPARLVPGRRTEGLGWIAPLRGDTEDADSLRLLATPSTNAVVSLLRGLTMARHLLVIGSDLDEPELLGALRHPDDPFPGERCGTLLDGATDGVRARTALWGDRLARVALAAPDRSPERGLEILLDRIGVHASDPSAWLLDERFAGLLAPRDQVYATQLRSVLGLLPQGSSTWAPLTEHVQQLGW